MKDLKTGISVILLLSLFTFGCSDGQLKLPFASSGISEHETRTTNVNPNNRPIVSGSGNNNSDSETGASFVLFDEHMKLFNQSDRNYIQEISGVELGQIRGWLANIYPWDYFPHQSTVHPVSNLWLPNQKPNMVEQCRQIREFGAGAVVLQYNPNPKESDHNYWLSTGFAAGCGPLIIAYEHINGTRYAEGNDREKNMDLESNRLIFLQDIDFIFKEVIVRNQGRYVTLNSRALIYMWSSVRMKGDFASLLREVKNKYPIDFIGSGEIGSSRSNPNDANRIKEMAGFMEYSLGGGGSNYLRAVRDYHSISYNFRRYLRMLETENGKRYIFIPTFQAAYDDSKVAERSTPVMYPRTFEEIRNHAEMIRGHMNNGTYEQNVGPLGVQGELPEGAAVIESQLPPEPERRLKECLPDQSQFAWDKPRLALCGYAGYGTGRLRILKEYFGS